MCFLPPCPSAKAIAERASLCITHIAVAATYLPFDSPRPTVLERLARAWPQHVGCGGCWRGGSHGRYAHPDGDNLGDLGDRRLVAGEGKAALGPCGACGVSCTPAPLEAGEDRSCCRFCRRGQFAVAVLLAVGLVLVGQALAGQPLVLP